MFVKSRLLIAAAMILGAASVTSAAPGDNWADPEGNTTYGPIAADGNPNARVPAEVSLSSAPSRGADNWADPEGNTTYGPVAAGGNPNVHQMPGTSAFAAAPAPNCMANNWADPEGNTTYGPVTACGNPNMH
jgi:hypothetical protein